MQPLRYSFYLSTIWASLLLLAGSALHAQTFPGRWDDRFGLPGIEPEINVAVADGNDVYVGGTFARPGAERVHFIARWDGTRWHPLGEGTEEGVDGIVHAIAVSGNDVYVGGSFTTAGGLPANNIAKWNRSTNSWSPLGDGVQSQESASINAIAVDGNNVYVGGSFNVAGTGLASNIAKWDGDKWSRIGGGVNDDIRAMTIADGSLYVGGDFSNADGNSTRRVARIALNSGEWETLGSGVGDDDESEIDQYVASFAVNGNDVYVGGSFTVIGDIEVNNIARWSTAEQNWSELGSGLVYHLAGTSFLGATNSSVDDLLWHDSRLYAAGNVDRPGSGGDTTLRKVAVWDGSTWQGVGRGFGKYVGTRSDNYARVRSIVAVQNGDLYAAGDFLSVEGYMALNFARWSQGRWNAVGNTVNGVVRTVVSDGEDIYVGGHFSTAGTMSAARVARWDAAAGNWEVLGGGYPETLGRRAHVQTLLVNGSDIYAAGTDGLGGFVMKWSGNGPWISLGDPFPGSGTDTISVYALAMIGNSLYAGGKGLARLDGSTWNSIAVTTDTTNIHCMLADGDKLYVGGSFTSVGGFQSNHIALWNSTTSTWSALGDGTNGPVDAMAFRNDTLYAGGRFTEAGGMPEGFIAGYSIQDDQWFSLGSGMDSAVYALTIDDNGMLFAGGEFGEAGQEIARFIAAWDGSAWLPFDGSVLSTLESPIVYGVAVMGKDIYLGGDFTDAAQHASYFFAHYMSGTSSVREKKSQSDGLNITSYPTPSAGSLTFRLYLPRASDHVSIVLYNLLGQEIDRIEPGSCPGGETRIRRDVAGLPEGTYFVRLMADGKEASGTCIISR